MSDTYAAHLQRAAELGKRIQNLTESDMIPQFQLGDYVLVATPKTTKQHKLSAVWRGPYRVIGTVSEYVYEMEHLVTNVVSQAHIQRMKYYADSELDMDIPELMDDIQHESTVFNAYDVESIQSHKYDTGSMQYVLHIKWGGFSEVENTWEPFLDLLEQVPQLVTRYVNGLRNSQARTDMLTLIS